MRISELSQASGVPVPTIKFYLRERLLAPGRPTGQTQAQYGDQHLERLRLIRALTDVGRLPLAAVRSVLEVVDAGAEALPAAVGTAHDALPPVVAHPASSPVRALDVVTALGWNVEPHSESLWQLEVALSALDDVGLAPSPAHLATYAAAALEVARLDVADVPAGDPEETVRYVVVGTVLYEPVLLALRRLAHQHVFSSRGRARQP